MVKLWVEHYEKDPKPAMVELLTMLFEVILEVMKIRGTKPQENHELRSFKVIERNRYFASDPINDFTNCNKILMIIACLVKRYLAWEFKLTIASLSLYIYLILY